MKTRRVGMGIYRSMGGVRCVARCIEFIVERNLVRLSSGEDRIV